VWKNNFFKKKQKNARIRSEKPEGGDAGGGGDLFCGCSGDET
jgi:hypothetical protein